MIKDFLIDQVVPNTAEATIGYNWYDQHKLINNATKIQIQEVLNGI